MKHTDDGTLSLFGDAPTPPPAATPQASPTAKKPRAKRKPKDANELQQPSERSTEAAAEATQASQAEAPTSEAIGEAAEVPNPIEATLHLANSLAPQPRRNSPWAGAPAAAEGKTPTAVATVEPQHKPHVMLVITKGEAGGAQSHVLALCQALHTQVHFTVVIGGPAQASVLGEQLQTLGVHVCSMPEMVESMLPWRLWPAVQQLTALIEASPPDLIHAHSAIAGLAARLACQRTARPVVYTVHGFGFKAQVPWLRRQLAGLAERQLSGGTTQMICVSAFERELAHQLPIAPERVHIIPNGIEPLPAELRKAVPAVAAQEDQSRAVVETTTPRVIMVARMKAPKRHDVLLRALAQVRNTLGYELAVSLAGDGPLRAAHEAHDRGVVDVAGGRDHQHARGAGRGGGGPGRGGPGRDLRRRRAVGQPGLPLRGAGRAGVADRRGQRHAGEPAVDAPRHRRGAGTAGRAPAEGSRRGRRRRCRGCSRRC